MDIHHVCTSIAIEFGSLVLQAGESRLCAVAAQTKVKEGLVDEGVQHG